MLIGKTSIYRSKAIDNYMKSRDMSVIAHIAFPQVTIFLYLLLIIFTVSICVGWYAKFPVYRSVLIAIADPNKENLNHSNEVIVFVLLNKESLTMPLIGRKVFFKLSSETGYIGSSITAVESKSLSAEALQQRFNFKAEAASKITDDSLVALINMQSIPKRVNLSTYVGSLKEARVEIGSRRVISVIPCIGHLFK
jgi:hypothetical protein